MHALIASSVGENALFGRHGGGQFFIVSFFAKILRKKSALTFSSRLGIRRKVVRLGRAPCKQFLRARHLPTARQSKRSQCAKQVAGE
jgi:hypothetical protein